MNRVRDENADAYDQQFGQGANPAPTRAPLERREASPSKYNTSGMERSLGSLANKLHKPK